MYTFSTIVRRQASSQHSFKFIIVTYTKSADYKQSYKLPILVSLYLLSMSVVNLTNWSNKKFQGSYIHIPHDHIAYRYEILKVIGKGSFGQVLKVYDHKTHQHVALKMVRNEKRFHRQAQEEIRILEHLRKQDKDNSCNIIHMLDNFTFR